MHFMKLRLSPPFGIFAAQFFKKFERRSEFLIKRAFLNVVSFLISFRIECMATFFWIDKLKTHPVYWEINFWGGFDIYRYFLRYWEKHCR